MKLVLILIVSLSQVINVCTIENEQSSFAYYDDGLSNRDGSFNSVSAHSSSLPQQRPFIDPEVLGFLVIGVGAVAVVSLLGFVVSSWRGGNPFSVNFGKTIPEKTLEIIEKFGSVINDPERLDNLSGKVNEAIEILSSFNNINISNIHKIKLQ
jgi:hypothetical protein